MPHEVHESVVVITGASSGIGRATALELARARADLVLAARGAAALKEVAAECERLGARALAVPTDVSDPAQVSELARRALESFGRIDVWINNAGVGMMGRFEDCPPEVFRKVVETNFFGTVNGARAVLPHFRRQGSGTLINMASMVAKAGYPYASAYVASKFAIRGLSESLRQELLGEDAIHVCTVMPGTVDTPLFQHEANYTGRALKPVPPVAPVEKVVKTIIGLIEEPRAEVTIGKVPKAIIGLHAVAPHRYDRVARKQIEREHLQDRAEAATDGNVTAPMMAWYGVSGGWRKPATRRGTKIAAITGLALLVPAAAALLLGSPRRARRAARLGRQLVASIA